MEAISDDVAESNASPAAESDVEPKPADEEPVKEPSGEGTN